MKSGVNKASFYDPEINRTYGAMAAHYSVGIFPARPGKPRDKAKAVRLACDGPGHAGESGFTCSRTLARREARQDARA